MDSSTPAEKLSSELTRQVIHLRREKKSPWPVTEQTIRKAARKIAAHVHPEKIVLFGSYARGTQNRNSDVDLLVVMQSRKRPAARSEELSRLLEPRPFAVDLLVRTPQEIRHRLAMGDSFIHDILQNGRTLYARSIHTRVA